MTEVTCLLSAIGQGDPAAAERLLPLVYDELRRLAAQRMAQEGPDRTLQPTALVHEAYLRLVDVETAQHWNSRGHFFAAAAEAMRRILIDSARKRTRLKRGGGMRRMELQEATQAEGVPAEEVLAVGEALDHLARVSPVAAELVKLRFFVGLTGREAAECLSISPRKADQVWAYARAWLHERLHSDAR